MKFTCMDEPAPLSLFIDFILHLCQPVFVTRYEGNKSMKETSIMALIYRVFITNSRFKGVCHRGGLQWKALFRAITSRKGASYISC